MLADKIPKSALKASMPGGHDRKEDAGSAQTGLTGCETGRTGHSRNSKNRSQCKNKVRPSFEELLANYKKKGATQKQKYRPNKVKSAKSSSKPQDQPDSCLHQSNSAAPPYSLFGSVTPWFWSYPYYYSPSD
jgi:hypothetical protein